MTEQLPPLEFGYTPYAPELQSFKALYASGAPMPSRSLADAEHETVSLFNNGLSDIVQLGSTARFWRNLGGGRYDAPKPLTEGPEGPAGMGFFAAFAESTWLDLVVYWPLILLMALAVWRSGAWERRVIREQLADEVGRAVSPDEYQDILRDGMFQTRRISSNQPRGSAALVNAQHAIAFRKWRVGSEGNDPDADPLVAGWRADIARLRAASR